MKMQVNLEIVQKVFVDDKGNSVPYDRLQITFLDTGVTVETKIDKNDSNLVKYLLKGVK